MTSINIKFPHAAAEEMKNTQASILNTLAYIVDNTLTENQVIAQYLQLQSLFERLNTFRAVPNAIDYLNSQHPDNFGVAQASWTYDVRISFALFEAEYINFVSWLIANMPDRVSISGAVKQRLVDITGLQTIASNLIAVSP